MLIFFKIDTLEFNILIPLSFQLVKAPLKNFFLYGEKLQHIISFNVPHIFKSSL